MTRSALVRLLLSLFLAVVVSGCATVNGPTEPQDPWEGFNRSMYTFNDKLDRYVMKPVAKGYQTVTPQFVDTGITNFFNNIDDVWVLFNDLLQLKFKGALNDFGRIMWNSTVGLFGFIDVATHLDLPKRNEDFGQTLGYWGVDSGPYLVLPFFGPSTLRDTGGLAVDFYGDPVALETNDQTSYYSALALKYIDKRADLLRASDLVDQASLDPYVFLREGYLQRRNNLIYDGNPPNKEMDMFEQELLNLQ